MDILNFFQLLFITCEFYIVILDSWLKCLNESYKIFVFVCLSTYGHYSYGISLPLDGIVNGNL